MGSGKPLTEHERGQITAYKDAGLSNRAIAQRIGRSARVVNNFVRLGDQYGTKTSTGRPRSLSARQERHVCRMVGSGEASLGQLSRNPDICVHKSTLSRAVQRCGHLRYARMKRQPRMTNAHKATRLAWGREHAHWGERWKTVVFSDEKKFNLDGPDGWRYYWHDIRTEEQVFSKRQQGGGSVMVWGAFGYKGTLPLAFPTGRMKATDYQDLMEASLLPFGEAIGGPFWIYQQDNASIHVARSTWEWFLGNGVNAMDWPAVSPDLNPMENLWGILARAVYANGIQYANTQALKAAIVSAWDAIDCNVLQRLVDGMPHRVYAIGINKGAFVGH